MPVDNFRVFSTEKELQCLNLREDFPETSFKELQYEEVIFIDECDENDRELKPLMINFDSVFVNVEDARRSIEDSQTISAKTDISTSEIDPLFLEQTLNPKESISVLEKTLSSNVFKVSAKSFLPKVVDWSSESIENISNGKIYHKNKYPPVLVCEFCGEQFSNKDRVYKFFYHRNQFHTQEVTYKCPLCPKLYWGERELSQHVSVHVGKEHICEYCGITCQRKNDFLRHLLIHEDKKFSCHFCQKRFRRKDHLKIHERIHTNKTPYTCSNCASGFPQKHQLNLHSKKCKPKPELPQN